MAVVNQTQYAAGQRLVQAFSKLSQEYMEKGNHPASEILDKAILELPMSSFIRLAAILEIV